MTKGRWIAGGVLLLAIGSVWIYLRARRDEGPVYRFATVERGDLEATVTATGTLGAVTTVQVGTQVSGQVSAIYVDFNDRVKKGQLIARIDPTLQQQAVRDAQAGLERNRAEVAKAQQDYDRNKQLYERKVLTDSEFSTTKYALDVARANLESAQVALDRARQNLAYTSIYAPIDGVVVERNVDVGQTVAASLSAPQLFLIANDLSRLQILASVDESDIGLIENGQPVRFTVQAYPNDRFTGTVRQVRLQSTITENVVNYTAVVEAQNPGDRLLPGMTATVDFLTGSARNVLLVPNAALRFRATQAMLAEVGGQQAEPPAGARPTARTRTTASAGGDVARNGGAAGSADTVARTRARTRPDTTAGPGTPSRGASRPGNVATLWYLDASGKLATLRVTTGLTDGQRTEVRGDGLTEGMRIIIGVIENTDDAGTASSPFQTQTKAGGPRRPGGF